MAVKGNSVPREWFRIKCEADSPVAEIWVYDAIGEDWFGEGVSAKSFLDQLQALPDSAKTLRVHVNSPGGDVFDAVAIANMLRAQSQEKGRTVEMLIEGLAASAASIITCAGDSIKIASNAMMMIHNPSGIVMGQAQDMRSMADALDSIRNSIVATYRWVSQLSAEALQTLMDASTWMSADEALANGFVTEIMEPVKIMAHFDPKILATLGEVPEPYRERVAALTVPPVLDAPAPDPPPPPAADVPGILAECREAGFLELAEELIEAKATREQAKARVQEATEIRGLCAMAKLPELAADYIAAKMPIAHVKGQLTTLTAKLASGEITTTLPVDGVGPRPRAKTGLTAAEVYRQRAEIAANARAGQRGA